MEWREADYYIYIYFYSLHEILPTYTHISIWTDDMHSTREKRVWGLLPIRGDDDEKGNNASRDNVYPYEVYGAAIISSDKRSIYNTSSRYSCRIHNAPTSSNQLFHCLQMRPFSSILCSPLPPLAANSTIPCQYRPCSRSTWVLLLSLASCLNNNFSLSRVLHVV